VKLLIAAGGTGGHVYPALAVAQELKRIDPKVEIVFIGTRKGFEATILPGHGFSLEFMEIGGLHGNSIAKKIKNAFLLPSAMVATLRLISKHKPDVVFGIGGYVSGLLLMMSAFKKIPTAILEPNVVAGFTNKTLGKFVTRIYLAFEESRKYFPAHKTQQSGNPIREEILKLSPPDFSNSKKTIFIFGGSQGARKINLAVMEMIQNDADYWKNFSFIHQTGPSGIKEVESIYQKFGIDAEVRPYFDKIMEAYAKCHFVIARAGSSILEIAAIGRPSILIPYPYAAGHQLYNAEILVKHGAAYLLKDAECSGQTLSNILKPAMQFPETLKNMSQKALIFRHEHAASIIAKQFLSWAQK
jgi:UDP-N-acetylglucosamine--N-acetylmuramyl-(pentapeptide) pyrophosphoryl-undecaprenol N-acetylglucosamine transferase